MFVLSPWIERPTYLGVFQFQRHTFMLRDYAPAQALHIIGGVDVISVHRERHFTKKSPYNKKRFASYVIKYPSNRNES